MDTASNNRMRTLCVALECTCILEQMQHRSIAGSSRCTLGTINTPSLWLFGLRADFLVQTFLAGCVLLLAMTMSMFESCV